MAEAYFKIYDENGKLLVDLATQPMQYATQISTGKSNGSYKPSLGSGQSAIFAFNPGTGMTTPGSPSVLASFSVVNNKITWTFDNSGSSTNLSTDIVVFVYG